jgi:hypothetical protein
VKVSCMDGLVDWCFGLAYLGLLIVLCGGAAAGFMWLFNSVLGVPAVYVAAVMGVVSGLNAASRALKTVSQRSALWVR